MNRLPETYDHTLTAVLNDLDIMVTARNVLTLYIALYMPPRSSLKQTAEVILHFWFSSRLPSEPCRTILQEFSEHVDEHIIQKMEDRLGHEPGTLHWPIRGINVSIQLRLDEWKYIVRMVNTTYPMTKASLQRMHRSLGDRERDDFGRWCFRQLPYIRMCSFHFRYTGVLLPFGHWLHRFDMVNP